MNSIFFVIPAGGVGRRMNSMIPKQYLPLLHEKTVLEVTLDLLLSVKEIKQGVIGIAQEDDQFSSLSIDQTRLAVTRAGATRAETVYNGLWSLKNVVDDNDWVIVHDAARPGLNPGELKKFIRLCTEKADSAGGIMALPASDTLKFESQGMIQKTLDRAHIYLAQTPQMFRFKLLLDAYEYCFKNNLPITDESSAMEISGYNPDIYEGYSHNFKITYSSDIIMMRFLLREREKRCV